MKATFIETQFFSRFVGEYLSDDDYRELQELLLENPSKGAVMPHTGGFRKMRWQDSRRGKGTRGGLRLIYYWFDGDGQFWMFSIYDKDEMENLTSDQRAALRKAIASEIKARGEI